jgi:CheY-like chemotaxis protein
MKPRILMVDDEEALVWSTGQRLERERPDLGFEGFVSPLEAIERIRNAPPDVLVTDLRMPGMSGLELLFEARRVAAHLPVVVISAYGSPEIQKELRARSAVEFLEKPVRFDALLAAIDRLRARGAGFSGAISLPMLPDLIQIYTLSMANGALTIRHGERSGTIWFERGAIVHACCGDLRAERAVYELLRWQGGAFSLDPAATPPERSITASWQEVLMEGCRLLDEDQRDQGGGQAVAVAGKGSLSAGALPLNAVETAELERMARLVTDQVRSATTDLVSLSVDFVAGRARVLEGETASGESWVDPVRAICGIAGRWVAPGDSPSSVEIVDGDFAVAIWWNRAGTGAAVIAARLGDLQKVPRFRAGVARAWSPEPVGANVVEAKAKEERWARSMTRARTS